MNIIKVNIVALTLIGALSGCGGSDSGSKTHQFENDVSNGKTKVSQPLSITPWSTAEVNQRMAQVDTTNQYSETLDLCGVNNGQVIETKDLKVGFHKSNSSFNIDELKIAARLSQVALDEDINNSHLDRISDLGIDTSKKWIVCYQDSKTGNGSALFPNGFEFSPKNLDTSSAEFASSYVLAKHELFHVIQYSLLPPATDNLNHFNQYPRWFSEASAEFFAGKTALASTSILNNFIRDSGLTPYSINNYDDEKKVNTKTSNTYANNMYRMYLTSFNYLIKKGLSLEHVIRLTESSKNIDAFNAEMAVIENELTLPTTYEKLKDSTSIYQTNIITNWLNASALHQPYTDDIRADALELFLYDGSNNKWSATINAAQSQYTLSSTLPDGHYKAYVMVKGDKIYGPKSLTVSKGSLGAIDFSGVPLCTTNFCTSSN